MTVDDILAQAARCYSRFDPEPQWKLREAIEQAIADATAAERERCARLCEKNGMPMLARDVIRGTK
jgi:hypothetical protein